MPQGQNQSNHFQMKQPSRRGLWSEEKSSKTWILAFEVCNRTTTRTQYFLNYFSFLVQSVISVLSDKKLHCMMRSWILFLILSLISNYFVFVSGNNNHVSADQCPRFHVEEFKAALFQPLLDQKIAFVRKLLQISTDAAEEMLVRIEQRKGNDGDLTNKGLKFFFNF